MDKNNLKKINDFLWEVEKQGDMQVPARIIATKKLIDQMDEGVIKQATNVACLPGIQKYSYCMPDGHWGYGFPIGGVAAFSKTSGIISPGGVGYDINCGVRMISTNLTIKEVRPKLKQLIDQLFRDVPCGLGVGGKVKVNEQQFDEIMEMGVKWAVERGYGLKEDSERCEDSGCIPGADVSKISDKVRERGFDQIGTVGSGNHFLEVQEVKDIYEPEKAKAMGITGRGQIVVMIHCGSRGMGHQIATEYIRVMDNAVRKYGIKIQDRELVCAPLYSKEGQDYFAAMCCAANNAFVNRQVLMHLTRGAFRKMFPDSKLELIYDICHNIAKMEEHDIDGRRTELVVHRKGAARAMPVGRKEVPSIYKKIGQPVIIPGAMGSSSYLLLPMDGAKDVFCSSCHGAGRQMSRSQAVRTFKGEKLRLELSQAGVEVRAKSMEGLAEEAAGAYKNVTDVIEAISLAGICKPVVRVESIATMKG